MLPAVLASLAYRCSQVECSGWLSTIDARFNANLNGVYALQAGSSPFPGHTLENVVNQGYDTEKFGTFMNYKKGEYITRTLTALW